MTGAKVVLAWVIIGLFAAFVLTVLAGGDGIDPFWKTFLFSVVIVMALAALVGAVIAVIWALGVVT